MKNDYNAYVDEIEKLQKKIADARNMQSQIDFETENSRLDENVKEQKRAAYVEKQNNLNAFGTDKEMLSEKGLGSSGAELSYTANAHNAYQDTLMKSEREKENIKRRLIDELLAAQRTNDEALFKNAIENAKLKIENYWKEYDWAAKYAKLKRN